jgi:hypothetical protein
VYQHFRDKLRRCLEGLNLQQPTTIQILDGDYGKFLAIIISPTFENMDDGDRQELVWGQVLDHLDQEEQGWIEFLYTYAPSEEEAQEALKYG